MSEEKFIRPFHFQHSTERIGSNKTKTEVFKDGELNKQCYVHKVKDMYSGDMEDELIERADELAENYRNNISTSKEVFAFQFEASFTYNDKEGIEKDYTIRGNYHDNLEMAFNRFMEKFDEVDRKFEESDYDINEYTELDIYFNVIY